MQKMMQTSLYIHIPWCIRKCPYCDFNSHKSPETLPEAAYVQALLEDFEKDIAAFPREEICTIFIGGGTPSLFSAKAYEALFAGLQQQVRFAKDIEITLEANPGTVEQARFCDYRALGINRISLGIQSFQGHLLQKLGRIHDEKEACYAVDAARYAGFENINIDLMYALPQQTVEESLKDLQQAVNLAPTHLSWYELSLEPNTVFYRRPPSLPKEEEQAEMEAIGYAFLQAEGYLRYEISAFAKASFQAQHNLHYWTFGDYFGIGAGAHGKLTERLIAYRTTKHRQPLAYLDKDKPYRVSLQKIEEPLFEFMLNASRLEAPIPHGLLSERTGLSWCHLLPVLKKAEAKGLVSIAENTWQVTPLGRRYTNDLQALFLL